MESGGDEDFEAGLDQYLRDMALVEDLRVERVLKESGQEKTDLVYLRSVSGRELEPYVRKTFPGGRDERVAGRGYELLYHAQQQGRRFAHLPRLILCSDQVDHLLVLMEYVRGRTLDAWIEGADEGHRLAIASIVIPQLCEALTEMHRGMDEPVIHRDVKPSNVMCTGEGEAPTAVVLVDLGISRSYKPGAESDTRHFGTSGFAAPEQYGIRQTDVRTDAYATGMTLAYCLLGHMPAQGDVERGFSGACSNQRLCMIARKATAFDPDDRYQNAEAMRKALVSAFMDAGSSGQEAWAESPSANGSAICMEKPNEDGGDERHPAPRRLLGRIAFGLSRFGRAVRMLTKAEAQDGGDVQDVSVCPNCGAILEAQSGFESNDGFWICRACGQQLYGDGVYSGNRYPGVMWYCDQCGDLLNAQEGFDDIRDSWRCRQCGYVNRIAQSEIDG